jgi:hypothetical protein
MDDNANKQTRAADDFSTIAARLKELRCDPVSAPGLWWCNQCGEAIEGERVTYEERHDPRYNGCDGEVIPFCRECEGDGWVLTPQHPGPICAECPKCHNPQDNPCP